MSLIANQFIVQDYKVQTNYVTTHKTIHMYYLNKSHDSLNMSHN